MNTGMQIDAFAVEVERRRTTRLDFIAPAKALSVQSDDAGHFHLMGLPTEKVQPPVINDWMHGQLSSHLKIPKPYYDRMRTDTPRLLDENLNTWLGRSMDKRLVRTLDGSARAFLSDAYRPLDNFDLAMAVIPALRAHDATIVSSSLTEQRIYMKATLRTLEMPVTKSRARGDILRGGIVISNSEVGAGALDISFFVERLLCTNGLIGDSIFKRAHLGRREGGGIDSAREFFSSKTRQLDDAALWSKVKDAIAGTLSEANLTKIVDLANGAAGDTIEGDLDRAVEVTLIHLELPDSFKPNILRNLLEGGDLSRWGLANALTFEANKTLDYERATEFERAGNEILTLGSRDWDAIAAA